LPKVCFGPKKNLSKADHFEGWIRSAKWKFGFDNTAYLSSTFQMGEVRVEGVVLRVNQGASMQWIEFNTRQPD
jgi:hypothetical protein